MSNATGALVTIALAIVSVATLSVILSNRANTTGVIKAGGNAFAQSIAAAVSPITGQSVQIGL
jgi:hypothetical protein